MTIIRTSRRGFTLIELLVVIAIIAILAAMIMPVLARAKATAKRIQCVNNQKQLVTAWHTYASASEDYLVANARPDVIPSMKLWVKGVFVNPFDNMNPMLITSEDNSLFASYIKTTEIYVCPADRQTVRIGATDYPKLRSYALNAYVGWTGLWDGRLQPGFKVFRRMSDVASVSMPSGVMLFGDVQADSVCWPFYGVEMVTDHFFNFPGSTHNRGSVVSFADGHIDHHQWKDDRTIKAVSLSYHMHHESSPGNQDLAWLRERTTVRDTGPNRSGFGESGYNGIYSQFNPNGPTSNRYVGENPPPPHWKEND